jgi:hypothetical protein
VAAATEHHRLIKVKRHHLQLREHGFMNTTASLNWRRLLAAGAWTLGAVGAYFLLTRHFDHVLQAVPYLLLLACPLMHVFGHQHGKNGHQHAANAHGDGNGHGRGKQAAGRSEG